MSRSKYIVASTCFHKRELLTRRWTPGRLKGLDQDSHCTIRAAGFDATAIDVAEGVCLTDIKTGENLWGYDIIAHRASSVDAQAVMAHVSAAIW
jgi:hypothetical protein